MHWYHAALGMGAFMTIVAAWNVPRAALWVALGALAFYVSSLWHDMGFPYGAAFGAALNFSLCLALYSWAQKRWEMAVWNCLNLMLLIDALYLFGVIRTHYAFAVSLEAANWLALFVIGLTGIMEGVDRGILIGHRGFGWLANVHRALYAQRRNPPIWEKGQ